MEVKDNGAEVPVNGREVKHSGAEIDDGRDERTEVPTEDMLVPILVGSVLP